MIYDFQRGIQPVPTSETGVYSRRGKVIDVVERLTDMADNILRLPEAIYSECSGLKSDRSRILEVARNFRLVGATYL